MEAETKEADTFDSPNTRKELNARFIIKSPHEGRERSEFSFAITKPDTSP
jgi:hypothetical protein